MDPVVYSSTPFQAFFWGGATILFMFALGMIGAGWAAFNRKQKALPRIAMGCASIILLLAGIGTSIAMFNTVQNGDATVAVRVNEKNEVVSNCGDNGTCTSYLLETQAGQKFYDFTVAHKAYEKVEVGQCYQVTYYPDRSLFGDMFQEQDISQSYEASSTITRIELVDSSVCQ